MRLVIGLAISLVTALPLGAAELPATSKVDAVMVFPSGAEVRRLVRLQLEAGEHTVIIKDLPQQAIASSIRVEGKATGKLSSSGGASRCWMSLCAPAYWTGSSRAYSVRAESGRSATDA